MLTLVMVLLLVVNVSVALIPGNPAPWINWLAAGYILGNLIFKAVND